jgi:hypothetical protein
MGLETATYIEDLNPANPTSGDPKSEGDNHLRLIKQVLQNTFAGFPGLVIATGTETQGATVNDYVVTIDPAPAAYTASMILVFKTTHTNTGPATLAINALSPKPLIGVDGAALSASDLESGGLVAVFYDGTSFYVLSGNDRAARDGEVYTGAQDFTSAILTMATQARGDASTKGASTAFVADGLSLKVDALNGVMTDPTLTASPPVGASGLEVVTAAWVVSAILGPSLPGQLNNGGMLLGTDGAAAGGTASWTGITGRMYFIGG